MSKYTIVSGDTFELIARKVYGSEQESRRISQANPDINEPLQTGSIINIPISISTPKNISQQSQANNADEVAILIDGERFRFWDSVSIISTADSIDVIEFGAPFEPDNTFFREAFRPFSYKPVEVTVGGNKVFSGTMLTPSPTLENNNNIVSVPCYSLPGVLNDCTASASAYPLYYEDLNIQQIAEQLIEPFGLDLVFDADPGAIFEEGVGAETSDRILTFLISLAQQRNLIISNTEDGALLFWQSVEPGNPVAKLRADASPVESVTMLPSPQAYYSHVTGIEPVIFGLQGSQYTVKNARLEGVFRPFTFTVPDTQETVVKVAVDAKAGRMFSGAVSYSVKVAGWEDPSGKKWEKNTTVELLAPRVMIYKSYEFLIRSVRFEEDDKKRTAILDLVLPGSFSGKIPEVLPWDE